MASTSLQIFTLALASMAIGCSDPTAPPPPNRPGDGGTSSLGGITGAATTSAQSTASGSGFTSSSTLTSGATTSSGTTTSSNSVASNSASSSTTSGNATSATTTGMTTTGANTAGNTAGNGTTGANSTGANMTAGNATGAGGASSSSSMTGSSTTGGDPTAEPDCNAQMPSGGQQHSGNGTGGEDNLAWEIWSNTGMGELTTFDVPAFIASWNNAGGYLGRLGYEWNRFGDTPVPHTQRGTITAQFVSRKSGSAGGYSYIGMYGWTTDPCVEWYVVEDSYNNMPFNPGGTTNEGEVEIDGGTYIMYTRPTTGTGGSRCSGVSNWIQYYSMRKTARACGVISLTEHFNAWQSLGMDMSGALLEAKILVEVGGGVGNVELPIANVVVQ